MNKEDAKSIASKMLEVRGYEKLTGTYYEGVKKLVYPWDNCVHPTFSHCGYGDHNQNDARGGTETGRLSCTKPNMQNIPREGNIKNHFISRFGELGRIVCCDFSQIEVVAFAHLTQDIQLINDLEEGKDIHCVLGTQLYGEEITKKDERRQTIKPCTFLVIYGGGYRKLAKEQNLPEDFCKTFVENFYKRYPQAKEWQQRQVKIVEGNRRFIDEKTPKGFQREEGYLRNITGRNLFFKTTDAPNFLVDKGIQTGFNPSEIKNYPVQCVDADTEFLTPNGWKKIKDYNSRDLVASYNIESGQLYYGLPNNYIVNVETEFYSFTKQSMSQVVSAKHRMLYSSQKTGYKKVIYAEELAKKPDFCGQVVNTFSLGAKSTERAFEHVLRLLVAYQADGTLQESESTGLRDRNIKFPHKFHFTKERKINRLLWLLAMANIDYKKSITTAGNTIIKANIPFATKLGKDKTYNKVFDYSTLSTTQVEIIAEECVLWDGHGDNKYFTTNKENADFIQYCFNASGNNSTIREKKKKDPKHALGYVVWKHKEKSISYRNVEIKKIPSVDGKSYCFTTDTGFWLARRNGNVFVTGNSLATADLALMQHGRLWREAIKHRDKFLIINQVHDDIMVDCKKEYVKGYCKLAKRVLCSIQEPMKKYFNIDWQLPINVEFKVGTTWGNCKKYEIDSI